MVEVFDTTKMICEDLKRWGFKVATCQKHPCEYDVFRWQGSAGSKPDILFYDPLYENELFNPDFVPKDIHKIRAGFIETKTGDHFGELMNGVKQNSRYYKYFLTGKVKCFIGNEQLFNADVFLLVSRWSHTGMLYRGDEPHTPLPLNHLTERYNMLFPPHTMDIHSFQRDQQREIREKLRNEKFNIPKNKLKIETGIMISRIPFFENNQISDEYYAWIGNKILPVVTESKFSADWIETQLKFHAETDKALLGETWLNKQGWFPKSVLKLSTFNDRIVFNKWYRVLVKLSFYYRNQDMFGIK